LGNFIVRCSNNYNYTRAAFLNELIHEYEKITNRIITFSAMNQSDMPKNVIQA